MRRRTFGGANETPRKLCNLLHDWLHVHAYTHQRKKYRVCTVTLSGSSEQRPSNP